MLKVLIISKKNETAKKIINSILVNIEQLRLIGVANTLDEAKPVMLKNTPEVIITTNININSFIKNNFLSYKPGVIIISNSKEKGLSVKNSIIMNYNLSFSEMTIKISNFINSKVVCSQKEKAINLLQKLGFDFKLAGTNYLLDSIMVTHSYNESFGFEKLVKDIYLEVAKMNNTRDDLVKWAITRSINYMYSRHTKESYIFVENFFNIKYPEKPTPKTIITLMANSLELN